MKDSETINQQFSKSFHRTHDLNSYLPSEFAHCSWRSP